MVPEQPAPRRRGRQKFPTKRQVTIRLDRDLIEALKKNGPGWQTRLNDTLRSALLPHTVRPKDQRLVIERVIVDH